MMTPEGRVKAAVKDVLQRWNIWFYMPVQYGIGVVGIPDFICCWDGQFLAIECKAPDRIDNLTANQARNLQQIEKHKGLTLVVDAAQQVTDFLRQYCLINERREFHHEQPAGEGGTLEGQGHPAGHQAAARASAEGAQEEDRQAVSGTASVATGHRS